METETVEPEQPAVKESLSKTSGRFVFEDIPTDGLTAREVIVLDALAPTARERILRQRQLFEYKATGKNPELEEAEFMAQVDLPPEIANQLNQKLIDLRSHFPEPLTIEVPIKEVGVDDDRIRKVRSDYSLHEDFQELFRAIRWDNMKRAVEFIGEKIKADSEIWLTKRSTEDAFEAKKASVTAKWLNAVGDHLNAYVALANERIAALNAHTEELAGASSKIYTWEDYVDRFGVELLIDISNQQLAAATLDEDGTFEVDAQGELLIRLEYGPRSAYLLVGDPAEKRVSVTDLSVWNAANP